MNWNKHIGKKNRNRNGLADNWIKKVKELNTEKFPYVLMETVQAESHHSPKAVITSSSWEQYTLII